MKLSTKISFLGILLLVMISYVACFATQSLGVQKDWYAVILLLLSGVLSALSISFSARVFKEEPLGNQFFEWLILILPAAAMTVFFQTALSYTAMSNGWRWVIAVVVSAVVALLCFSAVASSKEERNEY